MCRAIRVSLPISRHLFKKLFGEHWWSGATDFGLAEHLFGLGMASRVVVDKRINTIRYEAVSIFFNARPVIKGRFQPFLGERAQRYWYYE